MDHSNTLLTSWLDRDLAHVLEDGLASRPTVTTTGFHPLIRTINYWSPAHDRELRLPLRLGGARNGQQTTQRDGRQQTTTASALDQTLLLPSFSEMRNQSEAVRGIPNQTQEARMPQFSLNAPGHREPLTQETTVSRPILLRTRSNTRCPHGLLVVRVGFDDFRQRRLGLLSNPPNTVRPRPRSRGRDTNTGRPRQRSRNGERRRVPAVEYRPPLRDITNEIKNF
jgi:hypothetical protein